MFYSIGKFAKAIGISIETLRNWDKQGKLIPDKIKENGFRYYSQKQLDEYLGVETPKKRIVIGYCRVSSHKQKDDLERQVENVKMYMLASCRLQGKRANKAKKLIKELMENDSSEEG